jgi:hypothetical protein
MAGTPALFQHLRIYSISIVANAQAKRLLVIANLNLDAIRMCVLKSIS